MKAEELRLGNLVSDKDGVVGKLIEVRLRDGFYYLHVSYIEPKGDEHELILTTESGFEFFNPIPISFDFFVKLGIRTSSTIGGFERLQIEYIRFEDELECWGAYMNDNLICHNLRYVHQIQNLHFALTGEELQFNDNPAQS